MPISENKVLENLLNFTALKQKVVSQNLANSETIGYKRRDVAFKDMLQAGMKTLSTDHFNEDDLEITIDENMENISGVNNVDVNKKWRKWRRIQLCSNLAQRKSIIITKRYRE